MSDCFFGYRSPSPCFSVYAYHKSLACYDVIVWCCESRSTQDSGLNDCSWIRGAPRATFYNTFCHKSQASSNNGNAEMNGYVITHHVKKANAVVIVLGHLGVTRSQLAEYSLWYTENGCSTIAASSPLLFFAANLSLKPIALDVLHQAATALNLAETNHVIDKSVSARTMYSSQPQSRQVPLIIHTMSNGGCFLLEQMELMLHKRSRYLAQGDLARISNRLSLGHQLFDSCPCFIRTFWLHRKGSHWTEAFPNQNWPVWLRFAYTAAATSFLSIWTLVTFAWRRPEEFWLNMENSLACQHQTYLYTTADCLSDASAVDYLIKSRRARNRNLKVVVYRWNDSGHCRLHKDHSGEYQAAIRHALSGAIARASTEGM